MTQATRKLTRALALAGFTTCALTATVVSAQTAPATPEHTFVPKVSVFSEYEYRGISQTSEKPAVQLNLDYSHSSGTYLGLFASNINWLKDYKSAGFISESSPVEVDLFGGYKFEVVKDVTLDIGYLHYEYSGAKGLPGLPKPNTDEVYVGASYGPFNVKYSYSTGNIFGVAESKGTTFIELNYSQALTEKLTLTAQIAKQQFKGGVPGYDNDTELSYVVYKIGPSYDLGDGWTVGGYLKGTNAKEANYTVGGKDWSKNRLVAFVSKAF